MEQKKVLEVLKKLAMDAGRIIMEVYKTDFEVDYKEDESPLTMADRRANDCIVKGLAEHFPECAVLSEEMKDDKARMQQEYCFIVDPLDGTKEFVKRNGQFTVNIALVYQQRPVVGVVYVPVTKDLYFASAGQGSFKQEGVSGEVRKLQVTEKEENLVWVGSKSHSSEKEENSFQWSRLPL